MLKAASTPQPLTKAAVRAATESYAGTKNRYLRWFFRLAEFGAVQAGVQLLTAISGLLIVRSLGKPEYALFAIANSMQTTCNLLADLGIGVGVRSIGGRVWNDPARFGALLNAALHLRKRFAIASLSVCLPITAWLLLRNDASPLIAATLTGIVLMGTIPLLSSSVYGAAPLLHGETRRIQKLDFTNATLRLLMIGALAVTRISAVSAALVGMVTNWIHLRWMRRWASERADVKVKPCEADRKELLALSWKSLPNAVFFCFQGQVTLFILTLFGNPASVADLTALGRLSALFGIFSVAFGVVIAPRFARCQDANQLPRLYWTLVGATVGVMVPLTCLAWHFPEPLLWLLGSKYASLQEECGWVVLAGCITQIAGVMWGLNSSKAWIRVQTRSFIPAVLGVQIIGMLCLDLRTFHDVLLFNLVSAAAPIPIYVADCLIGFKLTKNLPALK